MSRRSSAQTFLGEGDMTFFVSASPPWQGGKREWDWERGCFQCRTQRNGQRDVDTNFCDMWTDFRDRQLVR